MGQPEILPAVIAGPLLRRLEPQRLVIWLVGSRALPLCWISRSMQRTAKSCPSAAMPLST